MDTFFQVFATAEENQAQLSLLNQDLLMLGGRFGWKSLLSPIMLHLATAISLNSSPNQESDGAEKQFEK